MERYFVCCNYGVLHHMDVLEWALFHVKKHNQRMARTGQNSI